MCFNIPKIFLKSFAPCKVKLLNDSDSNMKSLGTGDRKQGKTGRSREGHKKKVGMGKKNKLSLLHISV